MPMTFKAGTRIFAECTEYSITGALVEDTDDLSSLIKVRCDDTGLIHTVCGWMWHVEVEEPEPIPLAETLGMYVGQAIKGALYIGGMAGLAVLAHAVGGSL